MDTISSSRRTRRALLPMFAFVAAIACAGVAADAATSAPPSSAKQKLASCMRAKGFSSQPTQAERASAKYRTAFRACAKKAGLPGTGANMQKYISCMAKHGITISRTSKKRPDRSSAAYKKANAACASLPS
jgi:hypothetical protein